jgi:tetratricopeptide (TPR) repeat protein
MAQTWVNFGNLLHRQDKHRDAEKYYRQAAVLRKTDNRTQPRALLQPSQYSPIIDFPEAEKLYRAALEINTAAGFMLEATDARYGCLARMHGESFTWPCWLSLRGVRWGRPRGESLCILDRAEVYLGLGLYHDALYSSRMAQKIFYKLKLKYEHSKASLFRGQALRPWAETRSQNSREAALKGFYKEKK